MDALSVVFNALADPTRRAILARLADGEASVGELAEPFAISLPAVSRHLAVLKHARLVDQRVDAQWRRCRITAGPLRDAADWIDAYREFWEGNFDRLAEYLQQTQAPSAPQGEAPAETSAETPPRTQPKKIPSKRRAK
jgi:DNA-binding transcriptional ArsR family regulator